MLEIGNSINLYYNLRKKAGDSSKSFNWNRFQFKYNYVESLLFIKNQNAIHINSKDTKIDNNNGSKSR